MRTGLLGNVLAAALAAAATDPTTASTPHPRPHAAPADLTRALVTKNVSYLGRTFTIPASWPVVQLTAGSTTCVRFDQHAVYLGAPPADQRCNAGTIGRTDALVIQPVPGPGAARASENLASHQIDAYAPGISVTATYSSSSAQIRDILTSAGLPLPAAAGARSAPRLRPETSPAAAAAPADATDLTGLGADPCSAPSSNAMKAWRANSPYGAIGIYIGGANMGCSQPNLTPGWVSAQAAAGWHFFLLYVGPQAPGSSCSSCSTITSAAADGASAAQDAAANAASLGFGAGTKIIYDMEAYAPSGTAVTLAFMSAWTKELHALGYYSGEYSSLNSGINDLINNTAGATMPDFIDFAAWDGAATTSSPTIPSADWANHQRIHQFSGEVDQTFGGYTINIDQDYLDVQSTFGEPGGGGLNDVTGDGKPDILAITSNGALLVYPNSGGTGTNTFGAPTQVGSGWNGYTIASVTDLYGSGRAGILAIAPDGSLLYYPNTGSAGKGSFGAALAVGGGWTGHTIVAASDLYASGRPGLLAIAPDGSLSYYPNGGGTGTGTFRAPTQVGSDWNGWTVDVADINGDGKPDLLAVDGTGALYLYPNSGQTGTGTFGAPAQVGYGWTGWRAIDTERPSGTGPAGILAIDSTGAMYRFPNTSSGGAVTFGRPQRVGSGWIGYIID